MNAKYYPSNSSFRKCGNCGAPIPAPIFGPCTCSYCGASYFRESPNVIVMLPVDGVLPFTFVRRISNHLIRPIDPNWRKYCYRDIATQLADAILDKIDFSESVDDYTGDKILEGKIRILDKDFCFGPEMYKKEDEDV